jgi:hypothetical protein
MRDISESSVQSLDTAWDWAPKEKELGTKLLVQTDIWWGTNEAVWRGLQYRQHLFIFADIELGTTI